MLRGMKIALTPPVPSPREGSKIQKTLVPLSQRERG